MGKVLLVVAITLAAGCCDPDAIGRPCANPLGADASVGLSLASPALDCPSKLCLITRRSAEYAARSVCTNECASDSDCMGQLSCRSGEACTTVGAYPRGVCVCREALDSTAP